MSRRLLRRWRSISLSVLVLVSFAVAGIGYLRAESQPNHDRLYLRNASGAVLFTHAAHAARADRCIDCHHDLAGPIVNACTDCHDDDSYTPDLVDHEELLEIEDHSCDGCHEIADDDQARSCRACHGGPDLAGIYHDHCNACHLEADAARFAADDGAARCSACHLE